MFSLRRAGAIALAFALVSCSSDQVAAPQHSTASAANVSTNLIGDLTAALHLTSAKVIRRTSPLPQPITVTKTIGWDGGTLSIPEAGVIVTVPRGALSAATVISMTARAGAPVAYDFAPHGIVFNQPLTFTQSLGGTDVGLLELPSLQLAYYGTPSVVGDVTALVSELINGVLRTADWSFSAPIKHFSGYILTCGRGTTIDD
jgi:hypothetical protein